MLPITMNTVIMKYEYMYNNKNAVLWVCKVVISISDDQHGELNKVFAISNPTVPQLKPL